MLVKASEVKFNMKEKYFIVMRDYIHEGDLYIHLMRQFVMWVTYIYIFVVILCAVQKQAVR